MINPFTNSIYEKACLSQIDFDEQQTEVLQKWLENPNNILFIYSPPGVGKTHFSAAITNMRFSQKRYCWYMSENDLFKKLRACIADDGDYSTLLNMMCENEFLILDDLGSTRSQSADKSGMTEWQKEVLFTYVDNRVSSGLPTVITSNYSIADLGQIFHERFTSRLGASKNIIMKLKGSDKRKEGL